MTFIDEYPHLSLYIIVVFKYIIYSDWRVDGQEQKSDE